jgi:predicted DCC family thiol-disulfide oxidoreductase YuxK
MTSIPLVTSHPVDLSTFQPIIFYDGSCGLCHRCVRFVLRHDRRGVFAFAPLQGVTFEALRAHLPEHNPDTIVLLDELGLHLRSTAVLRILRRLGPGWAALALLGTLIPRPLRDWIYNRIAHIRYRTFGRVDSCILPSPRDRRRFLP